MTAAFWIWGVLGLIFNGTSFWTGSTGSDMAYLALGNLIWIVGMVLFSLASIRDSASGDRHNETR
jgi:hypothetical protein